MNGHGKTIKYNCVRGPPSLEELKFVQDLPGRPVQSLEKANHL